MRWAVSYVVARRRLDHRLTSRPPTCFPDSRSTPACRLLPVHSRRQSFSAPATAVRCAGERRALRGDAPRDDRLKRAAPGDPATTRRARPRARAAIGSETGRIADERQRRQEFDRQRRRAPARATRSGRRRRAGCPARRARRAPTPDRPPTCRRAGRRRANPRDRGRVRRSSTVAGSGAMPPACDDGQPDRVRIVRQSLVGGLGRARRADRRSVRRCAGGCGGRAANGVAGIGGQRFQEAARSSPASRSRNARSAARTDRLGPAAVRA